LIPLAMLYLQYPHSFPNINAQQQIDQWRKSGYPEAGLAQVLLYRTQGTYDQHLDDVEKICKAALNTTDICYVELATVYQKRPSRSNRPSCSSRCRPVTAAARSARSASTAWPACWPMRPSARPTRRPRSRCSNRSPGLPGIVGEPRATALRLPELGDVDQMMKYLDNGRAADQPRAELLLGKLYYEQTVPADAKVAEEHFQKAVGREVAADYYLGQIYRRGYLGKVYPQKALDHLLTAARNGQNSADFAIAQLFSQGKGTKPDPLNAYVFSQLAKAQNTPQAMNWRPHSKPNCRLSSQPKPSACCNRNRRRGALSQNTLQLHALQEEDGEESL
jgi:alginate biosynthesis protein AlgK